MLSIKVTHNNEVRRLQVPTNSCSYAAVQDSIRNVFASLNSVSFSLVWIDDEGDKVTVSTDPELGEAIRVLSSQKAMPRFEVVVAKSDPVVAEEVHFHVSCDECGMSPIRGDRFKCTVRNDFDLCAKCESSRVQPFPMTKISANRPHPVHCRPFRGCPGGGRGFGRGFHGGRGQHGAVHRNVRCDDCGVSPIVGNRFKCTYREDFDLCEHCEAKTIQPYPLVKISDPSQAPVALVYAFDESQQPQRPPHHEFAHPHAELFFGHPGQGRGGRGGGRGGFRCGRGGTNGRGSGCPMFERGPLSGPFAGTTPEGLAALGRLSGYHNLDFTQAASAASSKSEESPAAPASSTSDKPAEGARPSVAEPVTVEALKAINPSLTSLIESFLLPITTPEQRAAGEKKLNEVFKAVAASASDGKTTVDGLPAGVYTFPHQRRCGAGRNHHNHFEERRQRRQYEQTTRDLNDEDAELQRALSECYATTPTTEEITPASTSTVEAPTASAEEEEDEDVEDVAMPSEPAQDGNESDTDSVVIVDTPPVAVESVIVPAPVEVQPAAAPVVVAAAVPAAVPHPPSALPSFIDAARREAAVSDDERWRVELSVLASMGFYNTAANLTLLKKYVTVPGGENGEGMQRVVMDLLNAAPASYDL